MEQSEAWESFYRTNDRPWRGVTRLEVPFVKGAHILEIGCGNGKTAKALNEAGMIVTGIDFSESAIELCRKMNTNIDFVCADVTNLPFDDSSFDGAVMFHVLEHLEKDEINTAVSELKRVLKDDSHILIRVFSIDDMRSSKGEKIDIRTIVRGNGIRYHYFDEEEIRQIFDGFECLHIRTEEKKTTFGETRSRIDCDFLFRK